MNPGATQILDELMARYPALEPTRPAVEQSVALICDCHHRNGLLLLCGNGGSAADCAHIVGELVKGFRSKRALPEADLAALADVTGTENPLFALLQQGVRAVNLCDAPALNTAILNDLVGELVFAQGTYAMGRAGDLLLGISTSGTSANVVRAFEVARARGLEMIALTGAKHSPMSTLATCAIRVPADETYEIQEFHLPVYHAICAAVERELFEA